MDKATLKQCTDSKLTSELIHFDDGHNPGKTTVRTKMAIQRNVRSRNFFNVYDELLSEEWLARVYEYAIAKYRPWGAYVSTTDALDLTITPESLWDTNPEQAIALVAVRALVFERGASVVGKDVSMLHGTAVWCLASTVPNQVNYHIDYAELYRYETNVIHPPLYAGTLQVSDVASAADMNGGDFMANVGGLEHYRKFGYKGKLQSVEAFEHDLSTSNDWLTVKYRRNRATLHDGRYPHLSTPIQHLRSDLKRVILGFNCFTEELAECCTRAPEHSDAFNRTTKLYQTMSALGVPITSNLPDAQSVAAADGQSNVADSMARNDVKAEHGSNSILNNTNDCDQIISTRPVATATTTKTSGSINVRDVMKNPALARLLVAAAKKVKAAEVSTR